MKKKFLSLVAIGVCLGACLVGCGSKSEVADVVNEDELNSSLGTLTSEDTSADTEDVGDITSDENNKPSEPTKDEMNMTASTLSSDWYSGQIAYGADVVKLPCKVSEIVDWGLLDADTMGAVNLDLTVEAGKQYATKFSDGHTLFDVVVENTYKEDKELGECSVVSLEITRVMGEDGGYAESAVVLPCGVVLGMAQEDVEAIIGESAEHSEDDTENNIVVNLQYDEDYNLSGYTVSTKQE